MKGFVAILICALAVGVSGQRATVYVFANVLNMPVNELKQCFEIVDLSDVNLSELETVLQGGQIPNQDMDKFLIDFGCFIICIMEKANMIQSNEVQIDALVRLAERTNFPISDDLKRKLNACIDTAKEETDRCKKGLTLASCFVQQYKNN